MGPVGATDVVVATAEDDELAVDVVMFEVEGVLVMICAVDEMLDASEVDADEVVEEPLDETIYIWRPSGPPQTWLALPAHGMLQRPSVAGTLPAPNFDPQ